MLLTYLTEIISKKKWKNEYGPLIYKNFDIAFYKKALSFIKNKIFTPKNLSDKRFIFLNPAGKSLSQSNIIKYQIDDNDRKIIKLINELSDYTIPENKITSLLTVGKVLNKISKKLVDISDAFDDIKNQLAKNQEQINRHKESRERALNKLLKNLEEAKQNNDNSKIIELNQQISAIKKKIDEEKNITREELEEIKKEYYKKRAALLKNKYIITLTYDTRAIASQSTSVGWTSCMNLDVGSERKFVSSSINIGTFIAYLATKKDKKELNDPVGRVLCKAYYGYDNNFENPDIIWAASKIYPNSMKTEIYWFKDMVQDFLNQNNKPKYRYYVLTSMNYYDNNDKKYIDVVKDFNFPIDSVIDNISIIKNIELKPIGINRIFYNSLSDLTDSQRKEVYEIARELAIDNFDITSLDDDYNKRLFVENNILLFDYAWEIVEDYIDEDDFKDEEGNLNEKEFKKAQEEWVEDNYKSKEIIERYVKDNMNDYLDFLKEIFYDNVDKYINIYYYLDEAFDIWLRQQEI